MKPSAMRAIGFLCIAIALTGCAGVRYHQPEREHVEPAEPVALEEWPDGIHIVCPDEPPPEARCPAGAEFAGYDLDAAVRIEQYVTAATANTDIAADQAEQIRALDAEADAANSAAAELERETSSQDRSRLLERFGWIGVLTLAIWAGI